jgi:hypothetical protein
MNGTAVLLLVNLAAVLILPVLGGIIWWYGRHPGPR